MPPTATLDHLVSDLARLVSNSYPKYRLPWFKRGLPGTQPGGGPDQTCPCWAKTSWPAHLTAPGSSKLQPGKRAEPRAPHAPTTTSGNPTGVTVRNSGHVPSSTT